MSSTTKVKTEQVHLTKEHVGRVWVDRYVYEHTMGWDGSIRRAKPTVVVSRYLIVAIEAADVHYVKTQPTAGPRVQVTLRKFLADGTLGVDRGHRTYRYLPTTGNEKTVEIEVAK